MKHAFYVLFVFMEAPWFLIQLRRWCEHARIVTACLHFQTCF